MILLMSTQFDDEDQQLYVDDIFRGFPIMVAEEFSYPWDKNKLWHDKKVVLQDSASSNKI